MEPLSWKKHFTINQGQDYVKGKPNCNRRQLFVSGWIQATAANKVPARVFIV